MTRPFLFFAVCLLSLCIFLPVQAREEPRSPSLQDAKTFADVMAYIEYESAKHNALTPKERAALFDSIYKPASEKLLELAREPSEKLRGFSIKFAILLNQVEAEVEGAEQELEAFIKGVASNEGFSNLAYVFRFRYFVSQWQNKGFEKIESELEAFLREMEASRNVPFSHLISFSRFILFSERAKRAESTPENFGKFVSGLKGWIDENDIPFPMVVSLGFQVAQKHNVPAEQVVKELVEFIRSPQCTLFGKQELIGKLDKMLKFAPGNDPKLYGRTLDDKDLDWESLRGKHVLIKFTATWCGPCIQQIPAMLEAYENYKDKGLEMISVYIGEHGPEPLAALKEAVEKHKLPWIILSESLTEKAGKPKYEDFYVIDGVPTFVMVDKEGKIVMPATNFAREWQTRLAEIFE